MMFSNLIFHYANGINDLRPLFTFEKSKQLLHTLIGLFLAQNVLKFYFVFVALKVSTTIQYVEK